MNAISVVNAVVLLKISNAEIDDFLKLESFGFQYHSVANRRQCYSDSS